MKNKPNPPLHHHLGILEGPGRKVGLVPVADLFPDDAPASGGPVGVRLVTGAGGETGQGVLTANGFEGWCQGWGGVSENLRWHRTFEGFEGVRGDPENGPGGPVAWTRATLAFAEDLALVDGLRDPERNRIGFSRRYAQPVGSVFIKSRHGDIGVAREFAELVRLYLRGLPVAQPLTVVNLSGELFLVEKRYGSARELFLGCLEDDARFDAARRQWEGLVSRLAALEAGGDFKLDNILLDERGGFVLTDFMVREALTFSRWMETRPHRGYLDFTCRLCHFAHYRRRQDPDAERFGTFRALFERRFPLAACEGACSRDSFIDTRKQRREPI